MFSRLFISLSTVWISHDVIKLDEIDDSCDAGAENPSFVAS